MHKSNVTTRFNGRWVCRKQPPLSVCTLQYHSNVQLAIYARLRCAALCMLREDERNFLCDESNNGRTSQTYAWGTTPFPLPQTQRIILQILPQWKSDACGNAEHVPCIYVRKIFCCIFATSSSLFSEPHKNPLCFIYATSTKSVTHQFFTTTGHSSFMILCDVFATLPSMRYLTFDPGLMLPEIGYVTLDLRWRIS